MIACLNVFVENYIAFLSFFFSIIGACRICGLLTQLLQFSGIDVFYVKKLSDVLERNLLFVKDMVFFCSLFFV